MLVKESDVAALRENYYDEERKKDKEKLKHEVDEMASLLNVSRDAALLAVVLTRRL
jgi:hypothetical protein